ncbi:MAG TPA: hypothetical protein VGF34_06845 [Stellaceae bacterium]
MLRLLLLALTPGALVGGAIYWIGRANVPVVPHADRLVAGGPSESAPGLVLPVPQERPVRPASPITGGLIGAVALLIGFGSLAFVL